jgi:hypothetical protein
VIPQLILIQYVITAASAGFNAWYFCRYRSPVRRRRIGALTLALLSAAILLESLYLIGVAMFTSDWAGSFFFTPSCWQAARLLVCTGSLVVTALILRRLVATSGTN